MMHYLLIVEKSQLLLSEKKVGIQDHLVITQFIYNQLHTPYKNRFSLLPDKGTPLGPVYVMNGNSSQIEAVIHEGKSEQLRLWIADMAIRGGYDELLIFSYTNESLYEYVTSKIPNLNIKILMRNWLVEEKDETVFNLTRETFSTRKTPTGILERDWQKAEKIRGIARQLMEDDIKPGIPRVDIRFYDDKPFWKGAILKKEDKLAAYVGYYSWEPRREGGGSPYVGENWPSIWVTGSSPSENKILDVILSRFDELWHSGHTYNEIIKEEASRDFSYESNINKVFPLKGSPYLIVYPGRIDKKRRLPVLASEDMSATYLIKDMIEDSGGTVDTEVLTGKKYSKKILEWDGHIIFVCHRTWLFDQLDDLSSEDTYYQIIPGSDGESSKLYIPDLNVKVHSPTDLDPPTDDDYCLISKISRKNGLEYYFLAGLHAIGTWGGAIFLTGKKTLSALAGLVEDDDFSVIISSKFSVPERNIVPNILHGPQKWPKKTSFSNDGVE